ncbi:hypothetical protein [Aquimarina sp. RZ0]|uniref:hypothetical protein n=1 Tax=Aquimarina sp. RZ0 TaxID=2607730 RepID=UPI0011F29920|nr:hypothetical protein [Aquimarina sp. RZ0]KAA1243217.1 hypothetical protein F0000_22060 [Aquimarina sp. RZ0]
MKLNLGIFVLLMMMFFSCQKEELSDSDIQIDTVTSIEDQNEVNFTNLIYKGITYSKSEVEANKALSDLVANSEFTFINEIELDNSEIKTDLYVYDSEKEHLANDAILTEQFEKEFKAYEKAQQLSKESKVRRTGRLAIELYNRTNQRGKIYRRVKHGLPTNFRGFPENFVGRNSNDRADSYSFRVSGFPGRTGSIGFFEDAVRRGRRLATGFARNNQLIKYNFANYARNRVSSFGVVVLN